MAILRPLNEITRESVILALEPARECTCSCTYCFAALNSRTQNIGKQKNLSDPGTFESIINRSYSSSYDPEHFLEWAVKNKLVLGYANAVEPFQDVPQARGILSTCDKLGLPLFVQTKSLNFNAVWDIYKNFHNNSILFASIPSLDNRIIKRFEPGTPPIEDRLSMIETAINAGFHVILALSPYHERWCKDPESLVLKAKSLGITEVFFDHLHLNRRQRSVATDKVMVNLADHTEAALWPDEAIEHFEIIYNTCIDNDIDFFATGLMGSCYGWHNTLASISPVGTYKRGFQWPYHDGTLFLNLHNDFYDDIDDEGNEVTLNPLDRDFNDSIIINWATVLQLMEIDGRRVNQNFKWSSLSDLIIIDEIPAECHHLLKPTAPIQEYYRQLWNNPNKRQFVWRHPHIKIAMQPNDTPWLDNDGNLIAIYDPDWITNEKSRICEDIDDYRYFTLENESAEEVIDNG